MKHLLTAAFLCCSLHLAAQDADEWKPASKESQAYAEYRSKITVPPYGLAKVKKLIAGIQAPDEDVPAKPADKDYMALSLREKFTYHMIHAEIFSQNCDVQPPVQDEHKKIFGTLPDAFDEQSWSERQLNFLTSNRDSVMAIIKESVTRSKRMGVNYKHAVVEVNGKEMIPFLIDIYNTDKKDHDILTVLLLLMRKNEYQPFMASSSYRKLYGDNADFKAYIDFNTANEALIIERATNFYKNR
ncbi:hypothetical protein EGT74_22255 [Chitinophaga lutea]|uniref:DUF4919 domain-containing protein n=1 Tax=Chitinophaga lutea TaxID=2488634 RepID=A0A3N4PSF3_9BACT|nr:hypothetical protein [Chitinophaga lutea]RPE09699.1 hypothetical protein EGT74_22255 [Chitinophaga lutea]